MYIDINAVKNKLNVENKELAKELGCSEQWLTNMKRHDKFPKSIKLLYKMSKLSGINMSKLIKNE